MKPKGLRRLALLLLIACGAACSGPARREVPPPLGSGDLAVELSGFRSDAGEAVVSLYGGGRGWPDDEAEALSTLRAPIRDRASRVVFTGLAYGGYAVSALHDEDGDGEMDRSWLGRPREGHGVSNGALGRLGPPDFGDARFVLRTPQRTERIRMEYPEGLLERRRNRQRDGRGPGAEPPRDRLVR